MKTKEKLEDQVIKYLLGKRKDPTDKNVWFGDSDFTKFENIQVDKILESLNKLQSAGYITYSKVGQRYKYTIKILDKADSYFDVKDKKEEDKLKELLKFLIPTIISIVSAVTSIISLYFSITTR